MTRLDQEMLNRGITTSRNRAANFISEGMVKVNGQTAHKPSQKVNDDCEITLSDQASPWVSRAALKLFPYLDHHPNAIALDLGASTGGFTQALLEKGVRKVFAVDVGQGQMHESLKNDPRVLLLESTNAKSLDANSFADADWPQLDIITSDLSFISLRKALPASLDLAPNGALLYALIKPQFELEPEQIGKGGLVKSEKDAQYAIQAVQEFIEKIGWEMLSLAPSPIKGGDGNQEYVIKARKS